MKLEVTKSVKVTETIDIELPYYYRHDLDHSVIFGRVEESRHVSIRVRKERGETAYELEIEDRPAGTFGSYMTKEYAGSREEFEAARAKLLAEAKAI